MSKRAKLLIGSELWNCRPKERKIDLSARSKENEGDYYHETYTSIIKEPLYYKLSNVCIGDLLNDDKFGWIIKLSQNKGKLFNKFGFIFENNKYLHLEEALYMLEIGAIQIKKDSFSISIEQLYTIYLELNSLIKYLVYRKFVLKNYIVKFHSCSKITDSTIERLQKFKQWDCTYKSNNCCSLLFDVFRNGEQCSKSQSLKPTFCVTLDKYDDILKNRLSNFCCFDREIQIIGILEDEEDFELQSLDFSPIEDLNDE